MMGVQSVVRLPGSVYQVNLQWLTQLLQRLGLGIDAFTFQLCLVNAVTGNMGTSRHLISRFTGS